MWKFLRFKTPLLAVALAIGAGSGVAAAYDGCSSCSKPVVVRPVVVKRTVVRRPVSVVRYVDDCVTCPPPCVEYSDPCVTCPPPVVYSDPCSTCPPVYSTTTYSRSTGYTPAPYLYMPVPSRKPVVREVVQAPVVSTPIPCSSCPK